MGEHHDLAPVPALLEGSIFAHSESMDLTNDPRFFTGNVIDKRLDAFNMLSVISGLMVGVALGEANSMKKNILWSHYNKHMLDATFQLVGFGLMTFVLFFNIIATYVGVAQPYHTYRLMTSGPTGFEAATSYYLNKNIAWWRHFAIKFMLISLPVLALSTGVRLVVKFDKDAYSGPMLPPERPMAARIVGLCALGVYVIMAVIVGYTHYKHSAVFRDRYLAMMEPVSGGVGYCQTLMQTYKDTRSTRFLDV